MANRWMTLALGAAALAILGIAAAPGAAAAESGGGGSKVALAIAGMAAGVLIVSLLVAEDITDEVLDAIEST